MKKITVLTLGLLCAGLLGACSNQKMESEASTNDKSSMTTKKDSDQSSKMAKDFSLQGVDGKTYKLSDFKGNMLKQYLIGKRFIDMIDFTQQQKKSLLYWTGKIIILTYVYHIYFIR